MQHLRCSVYSCWLKGAPTAHPPHSPELHHRLSSRHLCSPATSSLRLSELRYLPVVATGPLSTLPWFHSEEKSEQSQLLTLLLWCSMAQSCLTLCDPMDCSTPGSPVHHQLLELVKLMSVASVMPSNHLILLPPSPAPGLSQHQSLTLWPPLDDASWWPDSQEGAT